VIGPLDEPEDATPLSPEERDGLIPSHLTLRRELNEIEQANILEADGWAFARRRNPVDEAFGRGLHRRMFGRVWRWAGVYRTTDKNLGVERAVILPRLYEAFEQTALWLEHETLGPDEIGTRFHHTLVRVHPFPNGNGRWSRLMADVLVMRMGRPRFSWGRSSLLAADGARGAYIAALRAADDHDFRPLLEFTRS
jgi:Fic-DOC domain mobile mystery protein B